MVLPNWKNLTRSQKTSLFFYLLILFFLPLSVATVLIPTKTTSKAQSGTTAEVCQVKNLTCQEHYNNMKYLSWEADYSYEARQIVIKSGQTSTYLSGTDARSITIANPPSSTFQVGCAVIGDTSVREYGFAEVNCQPIPQEYRVFVTSTTYNGNLGGLIGADAKCQERANAVNLAGTWKAWLSDGSISASSRLYHSTGPYRLAIDYHASIVANSWADLVDGTNLAYPIVSDELGKYWTSYLVWTNTNTSGEIYTRPITGTGHCNNWTSNSSSDWGRMGTIMADSPAWTSDPWAPGHQCNVTFMHLYCFEQPSFTPTPTQRPTSTPTAIPTSTSTPTPTSTPIPTPTPTQPSLGSVTKTLNPVGDTYIHSYSADKNFSSEDKFRVGQYGSGDIRQGLIKFDLSSIPASASANVTSASMTLQSVAWGGKANTVSIYKILQDWNESTVTWNNKPNQETASLTNFSIANLGSHQIKLTSTTQGWVNNPDSNKGLLLRTNSGFEFYFASKENSDSAKRPKLTVTYTLP